MLITASFAVSRQMLHSKALLGSLFSFESFSVSVVSLAALAVAILQPWTKNILAKLHQLFLFTDMNYRNYKATQSIVTAGLCFFVTLHLACPFLFGIILQCFMYAIMLNDSSLLLLKL